MTCDYAACFRPGTFPSGKWVFCAKHAEDDRLIRAGKDPHEDPIPSDKRPRPLHGTESRYRQHYRDRERPCTACQEAATVANRVRGQAQRDRLRGLQDTG